MQTQERTHENTMSNEPVRYDSDKISSAILTVRGHKVIMDSDLAACYGVEVKRLNEQVRRNGNRFPADFVFQLTVEELEQVKCLRSQFATLKQGRHRKYLPYVFTEHGAIMAATVLNNPRAVELSVFVVRAFIRMRQALLTRSEMEKRLDQIEKVLLVHDSGLKDLYDKIRPLLLPSHEPPSPPVTGFQVKESRARYIVKRKK
jgi:hypothetical protein